MKLAYIHNLKMMVGSVYKYYTFLQETYGGLIINTNEDNVALRLAKYKPDLVFVRGDSADHYRIPLSLGIPYILIASDIYSMRQGKQHPFEKEMVENAAGLVFVTEDHLDYFTSLGYKVPLSKVIHLRPLKKDISFELKPKLEGLNLVYAGGINFWSRRNGLYGYRSFRNIFKSFIAAGWNVHIYSHNSTSCYPEYIEIGCICHNPLPYNELLVDLSQYTAGIQGYNKEDVPKASFDYTQTGRQNKTWDYLAAGIPVIGVNPGNTRKMYEGKWGIVAESFEVEYLKSLKDKLPIITEDMRLLETIDSDKPLFDELIDRAIKVKLRRELISMSESKWFVTKKRVIDPVTGRLLYGRNRRLPMVEAIRLGLVKELKAETVITKEDALSKPKTKPKKKSLNSLSLEELIVIVGKKEIDLSKHLTEEQMTDEKAVCDAIKKEMKERKEAKKEEQKGREMPFVREGESKPADMSIEELKKRVEGEE